MCPMKGGCTISFIGRVRNGVPLISRSFHGRRRTNVGATRGGQEYLLERDGAALTGREEQSVGGRRSSPGPAHVRVDVADGPAGGRNTGA